MTFDNTSLVWSVAAVVVASGVLSAWVLFRRQNARAGFLRTLEHQAATLSEQAQLLDLANDAILVWDLHSGAIRFWNRGAQELHGWQEAEALGRTPQALLHRRNLAVASGGPHAAANDPGAQRPGL